MKHTSLNKLNRLWKNGIFPALAKKLDTTKVLKTTEQVEANTNADNVASAVVVGDMINNLGGCQLTQEGEDFYIVGADSVRKKLGSGGSVKFKISLASGYATPTSDTYPRALASGNYTVTINLNTLTASISGSASVVCQDWNGSQLTASKSISATINSINVVD